MTNKYILEQVDIFEELDSKQLALVESICHEKSYSQGEVIFEENLLSKEFTSFLRAKSRFRSTPIRLATAVITISPVPLLFCGEDNPLVRWRSLIRGCARPRPAAALKPANYW